MSTPTPQKLNRSLLSILCGCKETGDVIADRLEELEADNAKLRERLNGAAGIALYHAECHERRGKEMFRPGEEGAIICQHEAQVCRELAAAIKRHAEQQ